MGKVIDRGKKRRAKQSAKERPKQQYYGGSKEAAYGLGRQSEDEKYAGQREETAGIDTAYRERDAFGKASDYGYSQVGSERDAYRRATDETLGQNEGERIKQIQMEERYGAGSDQSMEDYRAGRGAILGGASALERNPGLDQYQAGRGAILGGASELEGYARGAAAEYQDAAGAAQRAAAERNQRAALSIAAGRGNNAVRTALAGANAANAQSALDQQATMAAQSNQLNAMRNQAIAQAAGIRSGVGAADQAAAAQQAENLARAAAIRSGVGGQDQAAAAQLAQRQQAAGGMAADALGTRAALEAAGADYQLKGIGQQQQIAKDDATSGLTVAQLQQGAGAGRRDTATGAQTSQYSAQLGADAATDAQRQEWAKSQSPHEKFKRGVGTATLGILGS